MEPLTATAIATLAFTKFLEGSAGKLAEKFTEAAIAKMEDLRQKIWAKLRGKAVAEAAIAKVEQGDKSAIGTVAKYLDVVMEDSPEFAAEVQQLAQVINAGKLIDNSSMTQINNDTARGWQTNVEGGTAYIGEIHIHGQKP
jgi:predicted amino acid racemase